MTRGEFERAERFEGETLDDEYGGGGEYGGAVGEDKEKVEKRRALGRGLESLLPGPRVVAGMRLGRSGPAGPAGSRSVRSASAARA